MARRQPDYRFVLVNEDVKGNLFRCIDGLEAGERPPWVVEIRREEKDRTLAQNRTFHDLCNQLSRLYADHYGRHHSPKVWKELVKQELLGEDVQRVGGRFVTVTRGTSDLSVREFQQLLDRMPPWAWAEFELTLVMPDDYEG